MQYVLVVDLEHPRVYSGAMYSATVVIRQHKEVMKHFKAEWKVATSP